MTKVFTLLALVVAAFIYTGCYHAKTEALNVSGIDRVRYYELRHLAASRLDCPSRRLSYRYEGDKVHVMEGCGETVRYLIFSINNVWVKVESFHDRAQFKLRCHIKKLKSLRVGVATWQVEGCGRVTYYELKCGGEGRNCIWKNVTFGNDEKYVD